MTILQKLLQSGLSSYVKEVATNMIGQFGGGTGTNEGDPGQGTLMSAYDLRDTATVRDRYAPRESERTRAPSPSSRYRQEEVRRSPPRDRRQYNSRDNTLERPRRDYDRYGRGRSQSRSRSPARDAYRSRDIRDRAQANERNNFDRRPMGVDRMSNLGASLKRPDWNSVGELATFRKDFYQEHPNVRARTDVEVNNFRRIHEMTVTGHSIPRPIESFSEACFPDYVMSTLSRQGFSKPTSIQAQVFA